MENKILDFWGNCTIKTNLSLEELASLVSKGICGGIPFTFGKNSIWEEIPSMYIPDNILGMLIIIGGYGDEDGYTVEINPYGDFSRYIYINKLNNYEIKICLDFHLYHLLKKGLEDYPEIVIEKPENK